MRCFELFIKFAILATKQAFTFRQREIEAM